MSPRIILTAAHCLVFTNFVPTEVSVFFNSSAARCGPMALVQQAIIHPNFTNVNTGNDVALLALSEPLRFDQFVRPICLPEKRRSLAARPVLAAGWGYTNPNGNSSQDLLYVVLKVLPDWQCRFELNQTGAANISGSNLLCTHTPSKDICLGDSGGPLTIWDRGGFSTQVGLVSFTFACGSSGRPSGFTRLTGYLSWIKAALKALKSWQRLPFPFSWRPT